MTPKSQNPFEGRHEPTLGVLLPRGSRVVAFKLPINTDERIIAMSPIPGGAVARRVDDQTVEITNEAEQLAPHVVAVVPEKLAYLLQVPWKKICDQLITVGKGSLLKGLGTVLLGAR